MAVHGPQGRPFGDRTRTILRALAFLLIVQLAAPVAGQVPVTFQVRLGGAIQEPASGRLLIFAQRAAAGSPLPRAVGTAVFEPTGAAVAAREIADFGPGSVATVDGEIGSFPTAFSQLPPGDYDVQAILDRNHDYNYAGRGPGDLVSAVVRTRLPAAGVPLSLETIIAPRDPAARLSRMSAEQRAAYEHSLQQVRPIEFESELLRAFWGRVVSMRGWVALPPHYDPAQRRTYPTLFVMRGFGSTLDFLRDNAAQMTRRMESGALPPMFWVFLDHSTPTGIHDFVNSANNGPWGAALTTELIPHLERQYRMDARARGRFLTGHSSGAWAALWLQIQYPSTFGGVWASAPDPVDFHSFLTADLYDGRNLYRAGDGSLLPLMRNEGRVVASIQDTARLEAALGSTGGQMASLEWAFSPRGPDGRPLPLFDRASGAIDPAVASYWRDHFDLTRFVEQSWSRLRRELDDKIHLVVGTSDTFYLDAAVRRLQGTLDRLGARSRFQYLEGRTHFDLYERNGDNDALLTDFVREMYARARGPAAGR